MTTIDQLLADAAPPVREHHFDVAAGLRRLAREAGYILPGLETQRAPEAGQRLKAVARWWLTSPQAAAHVDQLVTELDENAPDPLHTATPLDVHGVQVFACLLHLTGHPESAQFWWELAASADVRGAAYCLHLHHLSRGEEREAAHWLLQAKRERDQDIGDEGPPEDIEILDNRFFKTFEQYVRHHDATTVAPTADLDAEVDRLARACDGLVGHPDQQLAERLHAFASRY
ncbi:hypothetical protein [Streptomyces sp. PSAA01]|uniref:hypothetical protein n=1 Tax=Streptomyces sp. PSAA01 TaxID=2912762 RepID=UPI001F25E81D|nr:hypothetical protein [Streptomyces sp. PSAA01]MCG0283993.1 hypothetical protein [Streptomyces sp. PSAA01]